MASSITNNCYMNKNNNANNMNNSNSITIQANTSSVMKISSNNKEAKKSPAFIKIPRLFPDRLREIWDLRTVFPSLNLDNILRIDDKKRRKLDLHQTFSTFQRPFGIQKLFKDPYLMPVLKNFAKFSSFPHDFQRKTISWQKTW